MQKIPKPKFLAVSSSDAVVEKETYLLPRTFSFKEKERDLLNDTFLTHGGYVRDEKKSPIDHRKTHTKSNKCRPPTLGQTVLASTNTLFICGYMDKTEC